MTTKDIVYIAIFAALTATLGLLPPLMLPLIAVPITAQSLGCMLSGSIIGAKRGAWSQGLFLMLVGFGLPLLAGGRGGWHILFGNGGGFLLAFPLSAFVIGWLFEKTWHRLHYVTAVAFIGLGGIVIMYAIGIVWVSVLAKISLKTSLISCLPFVPGDLVKVAIATTVSMTVRRHYPLIKPNRIF